MIIINSGKMIIPENERFVGFTGDNLHSVKQFLVKDKADKNCIYRLYLKFDDGTTNYLVLDSLVENSSTLLTWNVQTEHLFKSGIVNAQIKAFLENGEIFHTTWDCFTVGESAESDEPFKETENAEFLRYEKELNEILQRIETGEYVPVNRKIAKLALSSDISVKQLREALSVYPIISSFSKPDKYIVGIENQLCISDIASATPALHICAGRLENGDYIWKDITSSVSQEYIDVAVEEYLRENSEAFTPIKGVDYFTDDDKAEIVNDVANAENVGGRIDELYDIVDPLHNESLNVFNKDNVVLDTNRYFAVGQSITRTFTKSGAFMTQGSFKCKKGDIINSNHSWVVEVLVYDDNGICLEQLSINKTYTVVSENATQFTVQGTTQDILSTLMITVNNDMPSVYTPYSKNLVDKVNDIDAQLKLSQKYLKKPFVVLSFDAFNLTDNRFKIVNDEYGYKATVANTTNEDTNKKVMKSGWDIGLYKYDNYPPDIFGYDEAVSETPSDEVLDAWDNYVKTTIENAESYGVFNPTSWLARQGCSCYGLETALKKNNIPMCRGAYSPDYSNDTQYSSDELPTMTVSCKQTLMPSTLEECQTAIVDAVHNNCGIAFLTHGIYSTDDEANSNYGITEEALRSFLDTIKTYVDAGQLDVLTYREVYAKYYPEKSSERDYNRLYKMLSNLIDENEEVC